MMKRGGPKLQLSLFFKIKYWSVSIINEVHNHMIEPKLEGCILPSRLNEEDNVIVNDIRNMVQPKNILMTLKDKIKSNLTVIKQV